MSGDVTSSAAVDICVPVLNEERCLEQNVRVLTDYLSESSYDWVVTIVDNGSSDHTWAIARSIAGSNPRVRALHLDLKGRGRALKAAWSETRGDAVAYMDVDLSTSLEALPWLLNPILQGKADVTVGSRLARGARIQRSFRRELISRSYNLLLRVVFRYGIRDAQCGFKALSKQVASSLLPNIQDNGWFFDTELLVRAKRCGLKVIEVPVTWVEDVDSRVRIASTAWGDLQGIWRLRKMLRSSGKEA